MPKGTSAHSAPAGDGGPHAATKSRSERASIEPDMVDAAGDELRLRHASDGTSDPGASGVAEPPSSYSSSCSASGGPSGPEPRSPAELSAVPSPSDPESDDELTTSAAWPCCMPRGASGR